MENAPNIAKSNTSAQVLALSWAIFIVVNECVLNVFFESIPDTIKTMLKNGVAYTGFPAWKVWLCLGFVELLILCIPILWIFFQNQKEAADPNYSPVIVRPYPALVRFVFRYLPFFDMKKPYFAPLRRATLKKFYRVELQELWKNYLVPHHSMYKMYTNLFQNKELGFGSLAKIVAYTDKQKKAIQNKLETTQNLDAVSLFMEGFMKGKHGHVLVLADSGMGKTTFLQKILSQLCKKIPCGKLGFCVCRKKYIS